MKKIISASQIVKRVLEENPKARDDDNLLWLEVIKEATRYDGFFKRNVSGLSISYVLTHIHRLGIPTFETVSRARRRIQEKIPELRGSEKAQEKRKEREKVFKEYAKK